MLLVGSRAAHFWFPDHARVGSNWDAWFTPERFDSWCHSACGDIREVRALRGGRTLFVVGVGDSLVEALVAPMGGSEQAFLDAAAAGPRCGFGPIHDARVASVAALAQIKRCHLNDSVDWHKHIDDYHFLKSRGAAKSDDAAVLAAGLLRRKEWHEQHPENQGSGSMKILNEVFFSSTRKARIRTYEHDSLHRATCYGEAPLYLRLKDDLDLAFVSRKYFDAMTPLEQVRLVREESYAIALERVVIPAMETGTDWDAQDAFRYALRRICTDLTSGWFRDFAIEHYPEVIDFDVDYIGRFKDALLQKKLARLPSLPEPETWHQGLREHLAEVALANSLAAL